MREAAFERSAQLEAVVAVVGGQLAFAALQPEMLEARRPVVLAGGAEGVNVVFAAVAPIFKSDAELERGLRGGHELLLVDSQQAMKRHERRNGRLAHAHGADLIGLHQPDVEQLAERFRQTRGHHPARGAAAGDHHASHAVLTAQILHAYPFYLLSRARTFARSSRTRLASRVPSARRARSGMCAAVSSPGWNT